MLSGILLGKGGDICRIRADIVSFSVSGQSGPGRMIGRAELEFRLPHPNPLDETTSHSTRLQETAAKSLVIPQAGEGANGAQSASNPYDGAIDSIAFGAVGVPLEGLLYSTSTS